MVSSLLFCVIRQDLTLASRKVFNMLWWNHAGHPLGGSFTLSPEDYSTWNTYSAGRDNFYLGYSLEGSCLKTPHVPWDERPRQAYILAKILSLFTTQDYILPAGSGESADQANTNFYKNLSETGNLTFLAKFTVDREDLDVPPGIVELAEWLDRAAFQDVIAHSRVLMGIGHPLLSPSPWEALCLGVPFINPVKQWDPEYPDDRTRWMTQHDGLLASGLDEPYVYHVKLGDRAGLERAILKAMETPIDR